jgi:AraC-like DNA-binding protein
VILTFTYFIASAQDTVFVESYTLKERVNNIDAWGNHLIARTDHSVYKLEATGFKEIKKMVYDANRYSWLKQKSTSNTLEIFNTNYIDGNKLATKAMFPNLIPGKYKNNVTYGRIGNELFINFNGVVLKYIINKFYKIQHQSESVRTIFEDDSLRIIGTYSGVFKTEISNPLRESIIKGTGYTSGYINKIDGRYYINQDNLYELNGDTTNLIFGFDKEMNFQKLLKFKKATIYLTRKSFGEADLIKKSRTEFFKTKSDLTDIEVYKNFLLVSSLDGNLFIYDNQKITAVKISCPISDIEIREDIAYLSCFDGIYTYNLEKKSLTKIHTEVNVIQCAFIQDNLIFTTFNGLFLRTLGGTVYKLIDNVEFNKKGLLATKYFLYAGSIDGLYVFDKQILIDEYLPSLTPLIIDRPTHSNFNYLLVLVILILLALLYLFTKKQSKNKEFVYSVNINKSKLTPEIIREFISKNEDIVSVEILVQKLKISKSHLTKILAKHNSSPLLILKEVKKEKAVEMFNQGLEIEKIAKNIGYSTKYIKTNFLK